jgi:hypothetical protein
MRQQITNVYQFDELTETAKEKAIDNNIYINVDDEWWESTYEDAERIGIKITGFDIDRGSFCEGKFIEDVCFTAHKIIEEHGEVCETYKTAEAFLKERDEIVDTAPKDENGDFENEWELDEKLNDIEDEFKKSILEDYRIMLTKEYEYLTSRKAIIDTIEANDLEFTEDGKPI